MTNKLKPCPFCGGKARTEQDIYGHYLVQCKDCGTGTLFKKFKQMAIEVWNRRTNATGD